MIQTEAAAGMRQLLFGIQDRQAKVRQFLCNFTLPIFDKLKARRKVAFIQNKLWMNWGLIFRRIVL
jgi:hypothetical protein